MPETRPNVLLVCTDQQFADAVGARCSDLETPAMDRIAADGIRFERAYCTQPKCTPSRASMLTGRMPHALAREDEAPIPDSIRDETLGQLFREAGYHCGFGGKWHLGGGMAIPRDEEYGHGFERVAGFDDTALADGCIEFLREDREDPFLLLANFDNPHNICEWARNETLPWGPVEEVPTADCPNLPANFPIPPFEPDAVKLRARDNSPMQQASDEEWRQYRHAYYRLIERVDREVGRILGALAETGHAENTIVVFTSDHGDGHGAHKLQQKWTLYEESARVPFILRGPGIESGIESDALVSTGLDLLPTLCEYADIVPPDGIRGHSVRPIAAGDEPGDWRKYVVTQTDKTGGRMIRTDRYKYNAYKWRRPREQLFDMAEDQGEMVNLAVESAHKHVLEAHREHLLEWCIETDDLYREHYAHPGIPSIPGLSPAEVRAAMDE